MDKKEIWLPVKGYEGLYEVSSFGRVRSLGKGGSGNSKMRVLSQAISNCHKFVTLSKNGKTEQYWVHRLVAEAFLPNWFGDPQVNHIDENPQNNNVDNLEWCDAKYNANHGTRNKRISEKMTNGKLSKPVLQFTKTGEFVCEWPSTREAERNGFNNGAVGSCCRGERKYYKGFVWRYKEVS